MLTSVNKLLLLHETRPMHAKLHAPLLTTSNFTLILRSRLLQAWNLATNYERCNKQSAATNQSEEIRKKGSRDYIRQAGDESRRRLSVLSIGHSMVFLEELVELPRMRLSYSL